VPFTGSHPAAVLPFLRTPLPASALVAGSLSPDVPYYLPFEWGVHTHTALAVVTTDLLLAAALWTLWHGVLAAPAAWATPAGLRGRLTGVPLGLRRRLGTTGRSALVLGGLAVGAATHVLWDEFTHPGRWGAQHVPLLRRDWAGDPGYAWAQEVSGVLGGLVLLVWLLRWWRRTPAEPAPGRPGWWWPWLAVAAAASAAGLAATAGSPDLRSAAVAAAFTGGGTGVAAAVVLALAWRVLTRVTGRAASPGPPGR
jgi:hypothetical protein